MKREGVKNCGWSKGLTAETDERVARRGESISNALSRKYWPRFERTFKMLTEGMTTREIAEAQGVTLNTIDSHLRRYRELADRLGQ